MANERLNIPQTLKVGFQDRKDTFSGKLAYVTYINNKGEIAKQTSWEGWRDKKIEVGTYENKPLAGFVLNKSTGIDRYSWNRRVTWCRVYDPRGFEVEISVDNLLYILQESSCTNKELSGEYVYAWDGKDLVLLPTCSVDYKLSTDLINKKEKITAKSLKIGSSYKSTLRHEYSYTFENGILKRNYQPSFISFDSIKNKPSAGGAWNNPLHFKTKDGDLIQKIDFYSKSEAVILF